MVDKEAIKKMGAEARGVCRGFLEAHLTIPTCLRKLEVGASEEYLVGAIMPLVGHIGAGIYPIWGYIKLFKYNKKIAAVTLATQITTNIASGVYEWYRYKRNKLNAPSVSPAGELEKGLEPPEKIEVKPVQTHFINPWEIEVPKIEVRKND